MRPPQPQPLLSKADVAAILLVHPKTVEALIRRGELDAIKLSPAQQGRVRIRRESVDRYLERLELGA